MAAGSGSCLVTWEKFEERGDIEKQFKETNKQSASVKSLPGWPLDQKEPARNKTMNTFQPIKILKRQPNSDPCLTEAPARAAPSRRIKTLEEREAAYAEARLRILGPSARTECETSANGHAGHNAQNSGAAKFPVEPNVKIISNAIRQNANGKT